MIIVDLKIKNESGLELTVTNKHPEDYIPIMGGISYNPNWEEYLNRFNDDFQIRLKLVRQAIEELEWVGEMAENIANTTCFVFSDGVSFGFTWRAWGDLMSAIVGKREGYMFYYM